MVAAGDRFGLCKTAMRRRSPLTPAEKILALSVA
jgi:hypothetical protein